MRPAATWQYAAVVIAVVFLSAQVIRTGAALRAHDSTSHRGAGGAKAASAPDTGRRTASPRPAARPPARAAGPDARLAAALAPILRWHAGMLAVGVSDPATGITATYDASRPFDTASIVKADILAVLLLRHQQIGTALSEHEKELAARMIENSDNNAASALWDDVQQGLGLQAGNAALGLRGIVPGPGGYWGLTTTTAAGQLGLLSALTSPHSPLHAGARRYELGLLRAVEPAQHWGVTAAAAARTRPAVKNGWLPVGPGGQWVINSIGIISHAGQQLLVVVLSCGQPSEAAGIDQVQAAARAAASAITTAGTPAVPAAPGAARNP